MCPSVDFFLLWKRSRKVSEDFHKYSDSTEKKKKMNAHIAFTCNALNAHCCIFLLDFCQQSPMLKNWKPKKFSTIVRGLTWEFFFSPSHAFRKSSKYFYYFASGCGGKFLQWQFTQINLMVQKVVMIYIYIFIKKKTTRERKDDKNVNFSHCII